MYYIYVVMIEVIKNEIITYNIVPLNKNSVYTTEHWTNILKNGLTVTVLYTQQWREGYFTIDVTENEKNALNTDDTIVLNDHGASVEELVSGWDYEHEIKNKEKYTDIELKEIYRLMYCSEDNKDEYDSDEDHDFNQDIMEENEWTMDDTIYEIYNGFEFEDE